MVHRRTGGEYRCANAKSRLGVAGGSHANGKYLDESISENGLRKVGTCREMEVRMELRNKSVNGEVKWLEEELKEKSQRLRSFPGETGRSNVWGTVTKEEWPFGGGGEMTSERPSDVYDGFVNGQNGEVQGRWVVAWNGHHPKIFTKVFLL